MTPEPLTIWTAGHSNRSLAELVLLLAGARIRRVADVRRFPCSRRYPHFAIERLAPALEAAGIGYVHLEALGGRRGTRPGSPHVALDTAFRGYADHMEGAEFRAALERLRALARERPTAILCAEARWRDCHRRLIADRLHADGARVLHLSYEGEPAEHALDPDAAREGGRLVYRGAGRLPFEG
jgi:uncharacterized protein (DUF488 family)